MNLGDIRGALRTVINRVDGVTADVTQDANQAQFYPDPGGDTGAVVTFNVISVAAVGQDEKREEYDADADIDGDEYPGDLGGVVQSIHGNRRLTVSLRCECDDLRDGGSAWTYLERVRTRLQLPSSRETLSDAGVGISELGPARDLSYDSNGRRVSVAQFDLFLNAADSASDDPVTTIERVGLSVNGSDEAELTVG